MRIDSILHSSKQKIRYQIFESSLIQYQLFHSYLNIFAITYNHFIELQPIDQKYQVLNFSFILLSISFIKQIMLNLFIVHEVTVC